MNIYVQALAVLMADSMLPGTAVFDTRARSTLWNNLFITLETLVLFVITLRGFPVGVCPSPPPKTLLYFLVVLICTFASKCV